ncbi:hypothetical protein [Microcella alkalica]|uniref:Uncharacterized protein n=1 Tax=Microcella alkalica TaxID=355930 RepID=A0A839E3S4_9MICO|nr:hypothetical protein [Microcella alkalica]MBA8847329.1 hypothetical protein [Microcella alkalica]
MRTPRHRALPADWERLIIRIQVLHCGEYQLGTPYILDIMQEILAYSEMEVSSLTRFVRHIASGAVEGVLSTRTGVHCRPEVVENVPMRVPPFAWGETDFPDTHAIVLAEKSRSHVPIEGMCLELLLKVIGPSLEIDADDGAGEGQVTQELDVVSHWSAPPSERLSWLHS